MKFKAEKFFQTAFKNWLEKNPPKTTEVHELKLVRSGNFQINTWLKKNPHQARGLMESKKDGCYHKLSDMSMNLKPFDSFFITGAVSLLVIYFNEYEKFIMLDISKALSLTKTHKTISFFELSEISTPRPL